jgi:hypothetical protein
VVIRAPIRRHDCLSPARREGRKLATPNMGGGTAVAAGAAVFRRPRSVIRGSRQCRLVACRAHFHRRHSGRCGS